MLNLKNQGMAWYNALKVLLILGCLGSVVSMFSTWNSDAIALGLTFGEYANTFAGYVAICVVIVSTHIVLSLGMLRNLLLEEYNAVNYCLALAALPVVSGFLFFVYSQVLYGSWSFMIPSVLGSIISRTIFFVSSYYYLKKRLIASYHSVKPNRSKPNVTLSAPQLTPIDIVSTRLRGITDQDQRNRIVSECFRGNTNPYTGSPIVCEADWNEYLQSYYSEKDAVSHSSKIDSFKS